jgi:membrane-bound lytic murein transglycosylase A
MSDPGDLFFMQVQGSGRLRLPDSRLLRLAYAGKTGLPYTAIGSGLVARGAFPAEQNSMQAIRVWMKGHPDEARALMWQNRSYVFFRAVAIDDPDLGPPGAQKVSLTPVRSLAVDRLFWQFGTPVWLSAQVPSGDSGTMEPFQHLTIAQDTGSAIKGLARGDVFWGAGERAALTAGLMKARGQMIVLLPAGLDPP